MNTKILFTGLLIILFEFVAEAQDFLIEFETTQDVENWNQFANAGDNPADLTIDANPSDWGINRSENCLRFYIQENAKYYAGIYSDAFGPIHVTPLMHTIEVMVYKPVFSDCVLKLEGEGADSIEIGVQNTKIYQWELLSFDCSEAIGKSFPRLTIMPDFQETRTTGTTCRIDNIKFRETTLPIPSDGLLAYYPFNGNAMDASGNGYHGIVHGAVLIEDRFGVENSAYYFDGTDDYIDLGRNHQINPPESFSISCFLKNEWSETNSVVFRNRYYGFALMTNPSNGAILDVYVHNNGGEATRSTYTGNDVIDGEWHHIAATWDSDTSKIYVDGSLVAENPAKGEYIIYAGNAAAIGRDGDGDVFYFRGAIDNLRIYDRVLDEYQVKSLSQNDSYQVVYDTIYDTVYDQTIAFKYPIYQGGPVRYLRFESYYSEDNGQVNVYEIQAYSEGDNIALNKPVVASSYHAGGGAAVDGDHSSRWSSDRDEPGPDFENPHFIVVDLEEQYLPDSILLNIRGWDSWNQTFSLLLSSDSVNWKTIDLRHDTTGVFAYPVSAKNTIQVYDTITATVYDSIAVTDTLVIDAVLNGIDPPDNLATILVYPNPAKDRIFIRTADHARLSGYRLKIIDQLGAIVYETNIEDPLYEVDLSTWTGYGIYYIQVVDDVGSITETRKIVLQ